MLSHQLFGAGVTVAGCTLFRLPPARRGDRPANSNRPKALAANWKRGLGRRAYPAHGAHRSAVAILQYRGPAVGALAARYARRNRRATRARRVARKSNRLNSRHTY